jgi:hypothetical protein
MRRIGYAALASAVALGGIAVAAGPASAGKPVLSGTISCKASSTINISPSLVLSIPEKKPGKPGKDKGPKFVSTGSLSNCTGTETSGLPKPTSATTSSKSKGTSRLCTGGGAGGGSAGTKNKIVWSTGAKSKVTATTSTLQSFNTTSQTVVPIPEGTPAATAFVIANPTNRLYFTLSGVSGGKAYKSRTLVTKVITTENITNLFFVQCPGAGISALHLDPTYSTFTAT